jgi:excisionase family DNA binding protein
MSGDRLMDAAAVAEMLGVQVSWVREHTRSGAIPCIELGRYRRYSRDDVLEWLDSLRAGGGPNFRRHRPQTKEGNT